MRRIPEFDSSKKPVDWWNENCKLTHEINEMSGCIGVLSLIILLIVAIAVFNAVGQHIIILWK